jgi:IrrE N-terminal-like domain
MIATDASIESAAREFWLLAGAEPRYPCDPAEYIVWALPLDLRGVTGLRVSHVSAAAERLGLPYRFGGKDRRLSGCLLAYHNRGIIFFDADDPEDERRFTLAHELGHFLLDYRAPRTRALAGLGESIRSVLDGLRSPTVEERTHAVMSDVHLGVLSHLMERPSDGVATSAALYIESRADRLALELLAPAALLRDEVRATRHEPYSHRLFALRHALQSAYGLPPRLARHYAATSLHDEGGPTFTDWLQGTDREERST